MYNMHRDIICIRAEHIEVFRCRRGQQLAFAIFARPGGGRYVRPVCVWGCSDITIDFRWCITLLVVRNGRDSAEL